MGVAVDTAPIKTNCATIKVTFAQGQANIANSWEFGVDTIQQSKLHSIMDQRSEECGDKATAVTMCLIALSILIVVGLYLGNVL